MNLHPGKLTLSRREPMVGGIAAVSHYGLGGEVCIQMNLVWVKGLPEGGYIYLLGGFTLLMSRFNYGLMSPSRSPSILSQQANELHNHMDNFQKGILVITTDPHVGSSREYKPLFEPPPQQVAKMSKEASGKRSDPTDFKFICKYMHFTYDLQQGRESGGSGGDSREGRGGSNRHC